MKYLIFIFILIIINSCDSSYTSNDSEMNNSINSYSCSAYSEDNSQVLDNTTNSDTVINKVNNDLQYLFSILGQAQVQEYMELVGLVTMFGLIAIMIQHHIVYCGQVKVGLRMLSLYLSPSMMNKKN